jgi:hypothetical protein
MLGADDLAALTEDIRPPLSRGYADRLKGG